MSEEDRELQTRKRVKMLETAQLQRKVREEVAATRLAVKDLALQVVAFLNNDHQESSHATADQKP